MVSHICRQMIVKGPFSDMHTRFEICIELLVKGLSRMISKGLFRIHDIRMIGGSSLIWKTPLDIRIGLFVKGLLHIDSKGLFHMNDIWMSRVSYMWETYEGKHMNAEGLSYVKSTWMWRVAQKGKTHWDICVNTTESLFLHSQHQSKKTKRHAARRLPAHYSIWKFT